MEFMPTDLDQRKQYVKDRRRARRKAEKEHKDRTEASEYREIDENVDRAWAKNGRSVGKQIFGGFGDGVPGSTGRWVHRNGELVRA